MPVHAADTRLAAIVLELFRGVSHIWVTQDSPGGFEWRCPCADHVAAQISDLSQTETSTLRVHLARHLHVALLSSYIAPRSSAASLVWLAAIWEIGDFVVGFVGI